MRLVRISPKAPVLDARGKLARVIDSDHRRHRVLLASGETPWIRERYLTFVEETQ